MRGMNHWTTQIVSVTNERLQIWRRAMAVTVEEEEEEEKNWEKD